MDFSSATAFLPVLLTGAGPGGGPQVNEFDALAIFDNPGAPPVPFTAFGVPPGNFTSGLFVSVS